uniref:taste receptor type 2 member 1-like n=1 Tax=Podarcis muralis TaxID=64176 RepID=UPI00109F8E32|nr:taste receptor type 2 member 1-like [Podarcis muralis]
MPSSQIITFLVALIDLALGGLVSNGFVVAVIVIEWAKCKTLAAREQLILSMAFGLFSRLWVIAWLCVFYCIKIVNSTHSLFLWCKLRISRLVPWLLGGSLVITFLASFTAIQNEQCNSLMSNATVNNANMTQGKTENKLDCFLEDLLLIGHTVCPFLIVFICSILVVTSLCRHVCQMTGKESKFRSPQTEAHVKAAGTVLFLLILSIFFYVAETLFITGQAGKNIYATSVCITVIISYSPVQAAILVSVNPKLKQAAARMLPRAKPS